MRIKLLFILSLLFLTSCSSLKNNKIATVQPYQLTKEQSSILQMTPIQEGNIMLYNIAIQNNTDEIHVLIEYYQNGTKVRDIANIASSHFQKKQIKLSFVQPNFQFEKNVQEKNQWYVNIEGSSMFAPENTPPSVNSSASTTIQSTKNLQYNQKIILAAIIKTNKENVRIPSLDEETAINQLLQENEHVYLFSIELKRETKNGNAL
jgi:hypothetical protein